MENIRGHVPIVKLCYQLEKKQSNFLQIFREVQKCLQYTRIDCYLIKKPVALIQTQY